MKTRASLQHLAVIGGLLLPGTALGQEQCQDWQGTIMIDGMPQRATGVQCIGPDGRVSLRPPRQAMPQAVQRGPFAPPPHRYARRRLSFQERFAGARQQRERERQESAALMERFRAAMNAPTTPTPYIDPSKPTEEKVRNFSGGAYISGAALRKLISGKTILGDSYYSRFNDQYAWYLAKDGRMYTARYGFNGNNTWHAGQTGNWEIQGDTFCMFKEKRVCYRVRKSAAGYYVADAVTDKYQTIGITRLADGPEPANLVEVAQAGDRQNVVNQAQWDFVKDLYTAPAKPAGPDPWQMKAEQNYRTCGNVMMCD